MAKKQKRKRKGTKLLCEELKLIHDADPKSSDAKRAKKDAKKWGCSWAK